MDKYLYGASIQGIQTYIFQTNTLKDIVGASDLVNRLCDDFVNIFAQKDTNIIVHAAGNIKCIFDSKNDCAKAVRDFPRYAMEISPGITISQAVVTISDSDDFKESTDELERCLHAQRNHPVKSLTCGLMTAERSRTTGLPAIKFEKDEYLDAGTVSKRENKSKTGQTTDLYQKLTGEYISHDERPYDTKDLTDRNDWIAVIHADGNGLGEVISTIGGDKDKLRDFSENLNKATIAAAQQAYKSLRVNNYKVLPIRPIVIGGDDLTILCRGDLAVKFVKAYLEAFEKETAELLNHSLTACAGIAYVKSSYPFYYGYDLAEELCGYAKKDAKSDEMKNANNGLAPSCLMFHKVQSSFVENYNTIIKKELTAGKTMLSFGPYYLSEQANRWTIEQLTNMVKNLSDESNNRIKTSIRQWLTLMHEDASAAEQHTKRANTIYGNNKLYVNATAINNGRCHAYDILSLLTIESQVTR